MPPQRKSGNGDNVVEIGNAQPFKANVYDWHSTYGWPVCFPLPPGAKEPPPDGITGAKHPYDQVKARIGEAIHKWMRSVPKDSNIGIRCPPQFVIIDVDAYGGKTGGETLTEFEAEYGELPETIRITARSDGISGKMIFRLPNGAEKYNFGGKIGSQNSGIELITVRYRYCVWVDSVHTDKETGERNIVRAYAPGEPLDGESWMPERFASDDPRIATLSWDHVYGITKFKLQKDVESCPTDDAEMNEWLDARPDPAGTEGGAREGRTSARGSDEACGCSVLEGWVDKACQEVAEGSGSYLAMVDRVYMLCAFAAEGHAGISHILGRLRKAYISEVTGKGHPGGPRGDGAAKAEWHRSVQGAIARLRGEERAGERSLVDECKCAGYGAPIGGNISVVNINKGEAVRQILRAIAARPIGYGSAYKYGDEVIIADVAIKALNVGSLSTIAADHLRFYQPSSAVGDDVMSENLGIEVDPPAGWISSVFSHHEDILPAIDVVVGMPCFNSQGDVVASEGYHEHGNAYVNLTDKT